MMLRTTAKSSEVLQGHCQHASESSESSDHRENIRKHGAKHWEIHWRCKEYRTWELRKSVPISVYVCVSFVCQKSQHFSQKNCVTCSSDFMWFLGFPMVAMVAHSLPIAYVYLCVAYEYFPQGGHVSPGHWVASAIAVHLSTWPPGTVHAKP